MEVVVVVGLDVVVDTNVMFAIRLFERHLFEIRGQVDTGIKWHN